MADVKITLETSNSTTLIRFINAHYIQGGNMKICLCFLGPWIKITKHSHKELIVQESIHINELMLILIELYGLEFEKELLNGTVYLQNHNNKYISIKNNEHLSENSSLLFLGPIVGG